jgi:hypothetical protein
MRLSRFTSAFASQPPVAASWSATRGVGGGAAVDYDSHQNDIPSPPFAAHTGGYFSGTDDMATMRMGVFGGLPLVS